MEQTGILRLVSRYWNGTTATGDALPGQSTGGYTGQPPQYAGQLGAVVYLNFADAQKRSDPAFTAASLQGGRYQYVQYAADGTAYLAGHTLYWKDETNYIVTNVQSATANAICGIAVSAITQGNYWLMQTDGLAYPLFGTLVLGGAGTAVFVQGISGATAILATSVIDATAVSAGGAAVSGTLAPLRQYLGTAKIQPVASVQNPVYLKGLVQVQ